MRRAQAAGRGRGAPDGRGDLHPGGPAALVGFANLEGSPLPILRLRALFGLPEPEDDLDHHVVVCGRGATQVGLALDKAIGLGALEALRSPTVEDHLVAADVVKAVGLYEGSICVVIDAAVAVEWLTQTVDLPVLGGEALAELPGPTPGADGLE